MFISTSVGFIIAIAVMVGCFGIKQLSDQDDISGAIAIAKKSVMTNAVLTFWQHVDQEPADELIGLQGHGLVPAGTIDAVIFDVESDMICVEPDQAIVGDGNPMGITRQICQHGFGSSKGLLGINHPFDFA